MGGWFAKNRHLYPPDWDEIAKEAKKRAGYKCQWCGLQFEEDGYDDSQIHIPLKNGLALTVHHLDRNPANNSEENLIVLCQKCHLYIQGSNLTSPFKKEQKKIERWL